MQTFSIHSPKLIFQLNLQKLSLVKLGKMAVFILEDALFIWTNLGKDLLFVWLFVCNIKAGTRRIMRLYERSSNSRPDVVQRKIVRPDGQCVLCPSLYYRRIARRTTNVCPSLSRRIMRLVRDKALVLSYVIGKHALNC